jgi:hypothetical protein
MGRRRHAAATAVRSLVVFSDTHCGCRLGLYDPSTPLVLDDGGQYRASEFQERVWAMWRNFWDEWIPTVTGGEPYDVVHCGDAIDGVHHRSTHQISHNYQDQLRIALTALRPVVARCKKTGGTYYHIRGTEAHVGQSAVYEEMLAEQLGAKPNAQGQHARYDLWKRVGDKRGPLVHLLHHVGTTGSAAHEASAVNAEFTAVLVEAARWGRPAPDFVIRGHRHRFIAVDIETASGHGASIVVPGWQGKTVFAFKIPGARVSEPQFGGVLVRQGERSNYYDRCIWSVERSAQE